MSLIINHNLSALNTHRNMSASGQNMAKSIEKLSSGYKINVGADDPSGLIISEQLRSQISGLERAVRNSSEAFNLISIAEGALNEMNTILKKMRALAIHAANSGVTSPEQVAADQSEMDSGIETLNRIANTTRYSDQYLLNGQKQLVYDISTAVNEPTDHALLDTKMTRIDQVFKRDGVKMSIGFAGEDSPYKANTDTSAQRAYLEADNAFSLCEIDGAQVTSKQEFILTGTSGSRLFSFAQGAHIGTIVDAINNVRDSTGIGAALTFASDVRIDKTTGGTRNGDVPNYPGQMATPLDGYSDGTYVYKNGDVQIYGAGLNNVATAKIETFSMTPDAASAFKVGFNCDGDGKIYAKVVDKSTNSIEYYKDKNCTMLIGMGDDNFFAATNNADIPSSPIQNLDGVFIKLNTDNAQDLDVFEIAVIGQRLDNQKDMNVDLAGWSDTDNSVMSGVNLGVNTNPEGTLYYEYRPLQLEADGETVKTFQINVYKHSSKEPKYLVATSGVVENNINLANLDPASGKFAGQTVRLESVIMDDGTDSGLNITLNLPKKGELDGITGETVEEVKASEAYQNLMKELATVKGEYAEVGPGYTTAQKARDEARTELDKALRELELARKEEARVRREIDRLDPREIDQQILDAETDLELSQNAVYNAARDAIQTKEMAETYTDITAVSPGAPEKIAEQMAKRILDEIEALPNPVAHDWADDAIKSKLMADVWDFAPLMGIEDGMTADEKLAIEESVDALLSAAYDAATDTDLVKDTYEKLEELDDLQTLETRFNKLQAELDLERANDFNYAIDQIINKLGRGTVGTGNGIWMAALNGGTPTDEIGTLQKLADGLRDALIDRVMDLEGEVGAAAFQKLSFNSTFWKGQKEDILDAVLTTNGSLGNYATGTPMTGVGLNLTDASPVYPMYKALLSDMYDTLTSGEYPEVKEYAEAYQQRQGTPGPLMADYDTAIDAETELAVATKIANGTGASTGKYTGGDLELQRVQSWLDIGTGTGFDWDDIASEISTIIQGKLQTGVPIPNTVPVTYAYDPATEFALGGGANTLYGDVLAVMQAAPVGSPALNAMVAAVFDGTDSNDEIAKILSTVWTSVTGPGTAAREYADAATERAAVINAEDAAHGAAALGVGTSSGGTGLVSDGTPLGDIGVGAKQAYDSIVALTTATPGGAAPAPLNSAFNQAVADAIADQLDILATEGLDIEDPDKLIAPNGENVQNLVVDALFDAAVAAGGGTIGEATLKQFLTDVFRSYVSNSLVTTQAGVAPLPDTSLGAPFAANGNPGTFGSYTETAADFAEVAADMPGGGQLQRAIDRRDRYLTRIENLPLQKAQTSASTRLLWTELDNNYPLAGRRLEDIAEDFGKFIRGEVENANSAADITWNDGKIPNDAYDTLQGMVQASPLWAQIQGEIANPATRAKGEAALEDLNKIINKMWESVTKPDYNQDVSAAVEQESGQKLPFDYVAVSPVEKYFQQDKEVQKLQKQLDDLKDYKSDTLDEAIRDFLDLTSYDDIDPDTPGVQLGDLVEDLNNASLEVGELAKKAEPLLDKMTELKDAMAGMLRGKEDPNALMPPGNQTGSVEFINLGLRVYSVDYGSAETIRIQNKAGNLFYQYREPDSMEKLMVKPDVTVQVAGQDAQISLNGAPIFTTGLIADTTTPDFAGSLVFNAGTLGETSLAIAGYDTGKLFSKATALQGVEENETEIAQLRRTFEPPAMTFPMGETDDKEGLLNENGTQVNLYMDFSQLDPSVEVKIDELGKACEIQVKFEEPDQLTINADSLSSEGEEGQMTIKVRIDPENLANGYYVTDPALKGLFLRTDNLIDLNVSGGTFEPYPPPSTTPSGGSAMLEVVTYATNPRKNTTESMENFIGGMQFQLGNTEGDQDRTIYSIQSMAMSELGRISWNGEEYCLQNVLGGGLASLTKDPILAMRVLAQAVDDVSTLRARLGAFQSNMLQSNINALGVAVENITKTESAIRDTDMAGESTQFTRFQIMQQAGTSMLAQANQVSQNVLSLLQ